MSEKLKPCPLCGGRMTAVVSIDPGTGEHLHFVTCSRCSLYFGISDEYAAEGKLQGNYYNAEAVMLEWNARNNTKILPIPCTNFKESSVKEWFAKINEELDELKEAVICEYDLTDNASYEASRTAQEGYGYMKEIAEEAADTITAITSMFEAMGIDEKARQEAQRQVNKKNKEKGRY